MIRFTFKVGKKIKDNTTTKRKKMQEPIKGVLLEVGGVHYEIMGDAFFMSAPPIIHYYFTTISSINSTPPILLSASA